MKSVKIIGGGLTGILAAFQAHRLGARKITLHERLDRLGGVALPELIGQREMREGCIYYGPKGDPIRQLLERHGVAFEDFDNRFGSVSRGSNGPVYLTDFGGPSFETSKLDLNTPRGDSLAERLGCYHNELIGPLLRYVEWHTGCSARQLHESAAIPMAINRIFPAGVDLEDLSDLKRSNQLANELFGIPRSLWGYSANTQASVPAGGFTAMFRQCRVALEAIGVKICEREIANPRKVLDLHSSDQVVVWAASPIPLFKAVGLNVPTAPARLFSTYTFEANWTGPVPFYVQNFTAQGSCFRAYIYESGGSVLLTAECVSQGGEDGLQGELHRMLEGFGGQLEIGPLLHKTVRPRWLYHSIDTIEKLAKLRSALKVRMGDRFVTGAWEAYAKGEKYAQVEADLQTALLSNIPVEAL